MKSKLTLQEKLRDLRNERKLTLDAMKALENSEKVKAIRRK